MCPAQRDVSEFEVRDPDFEARVRSSFARQTVMGHIGAQLVRVDPSEVEISLPFRLELTQQHDFVHAGIVATILDSACGYAAFSLMDAGSGVLTIEYKINLLAPARGASLRAVGTVIRPGRTITACRGEAHGIAEDGGATLIAVMQATVMSIADRPDVLG